jgi:hypothetical protein
MSILLVSTDSTNQAAVSWNTLRARDNNSQQPKTHCTEAACLGGASPRPRKKKGSASGSPRRQRRPGKATRKRRPESSTRSGQKKQAVPPVRVRLWPVGPSFSGRYDGSASTRSRIRVVLSSWSPLPRTGGGRGRG